MRPRYDHEYPPGEWTADGVAKALRTAADAFAIPTYDQESAWERVRNDELTGILAGRILEAAEAARGEPVPRLPASLYLDYERTGNRRRYQEPEALRRRQLSLFALAECLERDGRFLDPILDYAWAICEQATWVLPAHLPNDDGVYREGLPAPTAPEEQHVALLPAGVGKALAELDYVLGSRLHPALRERIRSTVEERLIAPYETRDDFHWREAPANNWNAVCHAGAVTAALYLVDDDDRLGDLVVDAAGNLERYLADFDRDGCTAEGISYWNYGFGNYVQLAASLATRTDGAYDLLNVPVVERIAAYSLRVELSPGHYVPFSDAIEKTWPDPYVACRLAARFELPGIGARGREAIAEGWGPSGEFSEDLRTLAWCAGTPDWEPSDHPPRRFLSGYQWWIARDNPDDPDGLMVAAKGGHNDEPHNHNDCGSFVVHANRESLLTDLGQPTYDEGYFSPRRYEYLAARSLGHSVPYVNGHEQVAGVDHAATVVDRSETARVDAITFELAPCYPDEAGLETLRREVRLDREAGRVVVADDATFEGRGTFESVLVSKRPMAVDDETIVIEGKRGSVIVSPEGARDVSVERLEGAFDAASHTRAEPDPRDIWRARIDGGRTNAVTLTLRPSIGDRG